MMKKIFGIGLFLFTFTVICTLCLAAVGGAWLFLRPQPDDTTSTLFQGVIYQRDSRTTPRPVVIHVIRVNLGADGVGIHVTPGDPDQDLPLPARRTSAYLAEYGVQVAINGDGFEPWSSQSLINYYPHTGDPVDVIGEAVSAGIRYSNTTDAEPTLYFNNSNVARINFAPGNVENAISGNQTLVAQGRSYNNDDSQAEPRTAVGLDRRRRELILVVVDGRQPGYSEGLTLAELADVMLELGAYEAINLDGGGSSTLVVESPSGQPRILNSPVNHGIPGRERPVGNHLGIFALPAGSD